ncbi:MAG: Rv1355c family protein [Flavobacteriales bacterium]|nr:Rv1355c family protein [Flavobacteriales bacterium]
MEKELEYKPRILDLTIEEDKTFYTSIRSSSNLVDQLDGQLMEFIKMKYPKDDLTADFIQVKKDEILGTSNPEHFGLWIYYPWSGNLVHTMPKSEFIQLRTIRNRYKITNEEQELLEQKVIGIVGLSVGQSIALTIASERICGELRIADFDTLELTNLNRIKAGIDKIGMLKTVIAARAIAEIDPFIKVVCYHDGITDNNIEHFLNHPSKLDLCIEECDGFYEKFNIRIKCKELGIPVMMDTSDMGLLDIERFDLEPEREIFHGLIQVDDLNALRNLTTDEKIPYLYSIIDETQMSTRLKGSLIEVGESIRSWPQLSSAVTYGSGMTTDVARRILLGTHCSSGRYSLDVETLITQGSTQELPIIRHVETSLSSDKASIPELATVSIDSNNITRELIKKLISDAILAPSGGNSQPWKWEFDNGQLFLFMDESRYSPYTDINQWGAYLALGCSAMNLKLSCSHHNIKVVEKNNFNTDHCKIFELTPNNSNTFTDTSGLYNEICRRQTNRNKSDGQKINQNIIDEINDLNSTKLASKVTILSDKKIIEKVSDLLAEADVIRFLNKYLYDELMDEIRWDKKSAIQRPWGVELDLFDLTPKERIGFNIANSWNVASFVKRIGGKALGDLTKKQILDSSALSYISISDLTPEAFYNAGKLVQQLWLKLSSHNVAVHPFAALSYFIIRHHLGETHFFSEDEKSLLNNLSMEWSKLFGLKEGEFTVFFCKLSYAPRAEMSQRIPVDQVLTFK